MAKATEEFLPGGFDPVYGIPPDLIRGPEGDVLPLSGEANWGMSKFDVPRLRDISDGTGVIVGVIDTGLDMTHPEIAGKDVEAKDFTGAGSGSKDRNGHGTHVSGTVGSKNPAIGVAPGAGLRHGKGLGDSGSGRGDGIAAAMRWCVERGAKVLSMSLGSSGRDPNIDEAGTELTAAGILICCAAGNSGGGTSQIDFPGRLPWAISVAALQPSLDPASFSSAGEGIETAAPGTNIWSCRPGGGYQQMSGTSMATPFCAGVLALYAACCIKLGKPLPTAADIQKILQSDSMDVHTPGVDRRAGPGAIWPLLLANNLVDNPPVINA